MDGPLKNLLVVDLTRVLVGPYCTMILSDLGARVIKVEAPEIGDDSRKFGPFIKDYSAYFMSLNRGKEICWVREWPFACNSRKTFALEISQITLQIFCSNNSSE